MKRMQYILWVGGLMVLFVILVLVVGYVRTYQMEQRPEQVQFEHGKAIIADLDGEYRGTAGGYRGSWQGKTIYNSRQSGVNRLQQGSGVVDKYPFRIYVGKGLRDSDLDVIKLDYNQPGNPWWLTFVVDEVVEVAPQQFLGKVHLHGFGVTFTVGYFGIDKEGVLQ